MKDALDQLLLYLRDIRRYRWVVIGVAWLVAPFGWFVVAKLPDRYEANAQVYVDTDSVLRPLLKGLAVETDVEERLQLMTKTLLSRPNLERVMRDTDMDLQIETELQKEVTLMGLQKSIQINSERRHENLYRIAYENRDPEKAKAVVQSLLDIFVEDTLGETRQESDVAQRFLSEQIREYERRLSEAEKRVMEYKRQHIGMLPNQGADYFARLTTAQSELENARFELEQARKRQGALKAQLNSLRDTKAQGRDTADLKTSVDDRLEALRQRLDELLLRYTERHPSVVELRSSIAVLEKQREKELEALGEDGADADLLDANPVYQKLRLSLGEASAEVAAAQSKVQQLEGKLQKLRELVDTLPKIEADLASLNRDYAINKEQYETLLARKESASMAEQVDATGDNVKFRIVEPPFVPSRPSSPNRPMLITAVMLAALGAGVGVALLLAQASPVVYDHRTLSRLTGLPVFGIISAVKTPGIRRREWLATSGFSLTVGLLMAAYGALMTLQQLGIMEIELPI
jgi:polysaccharide chain length determinant protein (PEP-CTERM system associated)